MADPTLNEFLKWSVLNTDMSQRDPSTLTPKSISKEDREAFDKMLREMQGDPVDVQMRGIIAQVDSDKTPPDVKHVQLENLLYLIESGDNADMLETVHLKDDEGKFIKDNVWDHLIKYLDSEDVELRKLTAWCCATAVQNRITVQQKLLDLGALPTLVRMATTESDYETRKKAVNALSSTVRNFQPALDIVLSHTPAEYKPQERLDAADMESVDLLINRLRASL